MLRFLADENFNGHVVLGLLDRAPEIDVVRVQDVGLAGADDPTILEWAAEHGRVVLTHDVNTMNGLAYERVDAGLPMAGVCQVPRWLSAGRAIEDLLIVAECSSEQDWVLQIHYLPL
jgi:hypothetical protein